jgi:hypothetical protein
METPTHPKDFVWNAWPKRLDAAIVKRFPTVTAETYWCIFSETFLTDFKTSDGSELDMHSAMMVKLFIEGFIIAHEETMKILETYNLPKGATQGKKPSAKAAKAADGEDDE